MPTNNIYSRTKVLSSAGIISSILKPPPSHVQKTTLYFSGAEEGETERDQNESEVEYAEEEQDFDAELDTGKSNVYRGANQGAVGA